MKRTYTLLLFISLIPLGLNSAYQGRYITRKIRSIKGEIIEISLSEMSSVGELRAELAKQLGEPPSDIRLFADGFNLDDDSMLLGIQVDFSYRLRSTKKKAMPANKRPRVKEPGVAIVAPKPVRPPFPVLFERIAEILNTARENVRAVQSPPYDIY